MTQIKAKKRGSCQRPQAKVNESSKLTQSSTVALPINSCSCDDPVDLNPKSALPTTRENVSSLNCNFLMGFETKIADPDSFYKAFLFTD